MLFHRWETLSHIISDTKLPWFTKTANEMAIENDLEENETDGKRKIHIYIYIYIYKFLFTNMLSID